MIDHSTALLWAVFAVLCLYCWAEWQLIADARPKDGTCPKHPGTTRCQCRRNLPGRRNQ